MAQQPLEVGGGTVGGAQAAGEERAGNAHFRLAGDVAEELVGNLELGEEHRHVVSADHLDRVDQGAGRRHLGVVLAQAALLEAEAPREVSQGRMVDHHQAPIRGKVGEPGCEFPLEIGEATGRLLGAAAVVLETVAIDPGEPHREAVQGFAGEDRVEPEVGVDRPPCLLLAVIVTVMVVVTAVAVIVAVVVVAGEAQHVGPFPEVEHLGLAASGAVEVGEPGLQSQADPDHQVGFGERAQIRRGGPVCVDVGTGTDQDGQLDVLAADGPAPVADDAEGRDDSGSTLVAGGTGRGIVTAGREQRHQGQEEEEEEGRRGGWGSVHGPAFIQPGCICKRVSAAAGAGLGSPAGRVTVDGAMRPGQRSEAMIRATGGRLTVQRRDVLAALLEADHAVPHHELEERFGGRYNRVTIYRVLDWLKDAGLVHRTTGHDRVWRFGVAAEATGHAHPHFECEECGQVECLATSETPRVRLPRGYSRSSVEVVVKGRCRTCRD